MNSILEFFFKTESERKKLLSVVIPSFVIQALSVILSFLINVLLVRGLGATDFGIFTYVFAIVMLVVNLSSYGLNILVVREIPALQALKKFELLNGLLKWGFGVVFVASFILTVALVLLTYFFHIMPSEDYRKPMLFAAIAIPFYCLLSFYSSVLRGLNRTVFSLLCEPAVKHVSFFVAILFIYLFLKKMELMSIIYLNTITFAFALLIVYILFRRSINWQKGPSQYELHGWWAKLGSLFLLNGLISLESKIEIIMLGYMKAPSQVAIFSCASKVAIFLSFFLTTMNFIIGPIISKLNTLDEKHQLQKMITKTIRWVMICSLPVFLVLVFLSKWIMIHIFGENFEQGQTVLIILCCAQLISILFGPVGNIMMMTGNEKYYTIFTLLSVLLTVILNFILIPGMGYNGAAIATASGIVFWNAGLYITTKRKLGISAWIFG